MGKPTGFLEFDRELPNKRPPQERVKDYKEFTTYSPKQFFEIDSQAPERAFGDAET